MRYLKVEIKGIVQGVGFRPFVYRIARERGIRGTVSNTPEGVEIRACGEGDQVYAFLSALKNEAPPQAMIEELRVSTEEPFHAESFEILPSSRDGVTSVLVSPDLATCGDCAHELFDEGDRRYRYPFINCTNCGPRFTIIERTPYDRPSTSMSVFNMCPECDEEYHDPADRRFHAQPNACPECGPRLRLVDRDGSDVEGDPVIRAADLLRDGKIVAVKGLGGFQLACDWTADATVLELRSRKNRYGKPFAVMVGSLEEARRYCRVNEHEEELLASPAGPIVLLREKDASALSRQVAGRLNHQGLFLPYTPLHHLLLDAAGIPLVMTSGNMSSEPIARDNEEAMSRLNGIADYFLLNDRDILVRYDDSVTRSFRGTEYPVRRARGYAPYPIEIKPAARVEVLAVGPELKNTFCLLAGEHAFVSQHIGDMETRDELNHFEEALESIKKLFSLEPRVVAYDLHPDYITTRMAAEMSLPRIGVQHHHAHIASCMADNRIDGEVIGVAWDGTGYGDDGTVWGGEFLLCDRTRMRRLAHLYQYPMPGADACIHRLYRMAAGVLSEVYGDVDAAIERLSGLMFIDEKEGESIGFQLEKGVNSPITSSAGRMFDVVAALTGLRREAVYDGQAACELEAVSEGQTERYDFSLETASEPWVVDTRPVFTGVLSDIEAKAGTGEIAGRFHSTMAAVIIETCRELSEETGIDRIALSGGVFQNMVLLSRVVGGLTASGLVPLVHQRVPCNDGGVSLGQAVVAERRFSGETTEEKEEDDVSCGPRRST